VPHMQWSRNSFRVSCDPQCLDPDFVATFLASTYWAQGIPPTTVYRSLEGSLCFSLLESERQVGFARVITDRATVAYLGDVFVLPEFRGKGLGTWLVECVLSHPDLCGLRRWILVTRDAHDLYKKVGFRQLARPEGFMELHNPDVYRDT
jgi:GNAT superfamily N-acetyltransferase